MSYRNKYYPHFVPFTHSIQFLLSWWYTVVMLMPLYSPLSLRLPKANFLSLIIFKVFIFILCVNGLNPELSRLLINLMNLPRITYVTHVYFTREAPFCKPLWVTGMMTLFIHQNGLLTPAPTVVSLFLHAIQGSWETYSGFIFVFCLFCFCFVYWDRVSLCTFDCPITCFVG